MFSLNLGALIAKALTRLIALLAAAGVFIMFTAANSPLFAGSHSKADIVPCDIKLVFGVDDRGMSLVSYDLEMQISNRQGRTITGISVHWLDRMARKSSAIATPYADRIMTASNRRNQDHAAVLCSKLAGGFLTGLGKTHGPRSSIQK